MTDKEKLIQDTLQFCNKDATKAATQHLDCCLCA